jgi:hypothetical protein
MNSAGKATEKKRPLKGRYANILRVGYNAFEFVFDFGQSFSDSEGAQSCLRIVTSPGHAKAMIKVLQQALEEFEQDFGGSASKKDFTADRSTSI